MLQDSNKLSSFKLWKRPSFKVLSLELDSCCFTEAFHPLSSIEKITAYGFGKE